MAVLWAVVVLQVFWHSSAHVLGECLECDYGVKLCVGPPTQEGFYYGTHRVMLGLPH